MIMRAYLALSLAVALPLASPLVAQDTRTVTEPKFPAPCATLTASLSPVADTTLADADEGKLDTQRIQQAIDRCAGGRAVVLKATGGQRAFLTGPLILKRGVTLLVDTNAILFASRNPRDYDIDQSKRCGTVDEKGHACKALITTDRATGSGVMGPGTIDGRGWAKLIGRDSSWWDLAQLAKVKNQSQSCPRLLQINRTDDFTLYKITLRNSPNFHVVYDRGNGFTAWGVVINTPDKRARNTDGIDPASATNVTITHSYINTGDDDVAIKAGNTGGSSNITVSHNHFYRGHGVSIGSETDGGAHAIRVFDLSIDGADNGLRIKSNASRGGLVHDVEYRDVCIRNTKNVIEMDTHYTASAQTTGSLIPEFRDIRLKGVRVLDGGNVILDGYDAARMLRMTWDDVVFDRPDAIKVKASFAAIGERAGTVQSPDHRRERPAHWNDERRTQARLREEVRAIPRQRCCAAGWRWRIRGDRRREIHRHRRRHHRRRTDLSNRRKRLDRTSGQRLVARHRVPSQWPLSRKAHRRPAARHAARRVARRRGADLRRGVGFTHADRRHLRHPRQLHAPRRRARLSRREHDDRERVRLSGERGQAR